MRKQPCPGEFTAQQQDQAKTQAGLSRTGQQTPKQAAAPATLARTRFSLVYHSVNNISLSEQRAELLQVSLQSALVRSPARPSSDLLGVVSQLSAGKLLAASPHFQEAAPPPDLFF